MNRRRLTTFGRELYESFIRIRGSLIAIITLVLGLIYFALSGNTSSLDLRIALPILVACVIVILTLFDLSRQLFLRASNGLPSVRQARKPSAICAEAIAVLLLDESDVYGHDGLVSIYYIDDGFEVLIGTGYILNRQEDGLIQVAVSQQINEAHGDVWTKVCANDSVVLAKLIVKPSLPRFLTGGS